MLRTLLLVLVCAIAWCAPVATARAAGRATTYKNCTALNKVYKGGVAKVGAKNIGGKTNYKPFYNNDLYKANSGSDRDKDGIACER